ncbi:MAG: hypothetical protein WCB05_15545 [Candidatus Sulfotelmatobacter sp.]
MSLRNRIILSMALPIALSALAVLAGCGNASSIINPTPPPSGSFSASNLNGTYVVSVSGVDGNGAPYAVAGTITANGTGGITSGAIDMNDVEFTAPVANLAVGSNSTYKVSVDGRGQATLNVTTPLGNSIVLDFVLQDSSHGLVTEFDNTATGSGTIDAQTASVSPAGSYAFSMTGANFSSGASFATVGNFAIGSGGTLSGLEDSNSGGLAYANEALSGEVVLGPSSTPSTTLTTGPFGTLTFDAFAIDANHLKLIEMDQFATSSGDAYSQTSTTVPTGALAFTLAGGISAPVAVGGFMVTDGAGNITTASTEDVNDAGNISAAPVSFSAQYTAAGTGRYTLGSFSNFVGGTEYAAYPSSGGLLLLEIDDSGIMSGAAYTQTATTFSTSAGYGLNLSGFNQTSSAEVDDIAEFATSSSGAAITGIIDENAAGVGPNFGLALSGTYTTPDSNGRGQLAATAGTSSNTTLNGGFGLTFYTVDGTTFPFIETDNATGQVSLGVFVVQNPSASSSAVAKPHMFLVRPLIRAKSSFKKLK